MNICVAIAAYREDASQLERCVAAVPAGWRIVLLGDPGDAAELARALERPPLKRCELYVENHVRERDKRNALMMYARGRCDAPTAEWVLMLDPDEELVNGGRLTDVLEALPAHFAELPAYPIVRQEPSGVCWSMPCKLVRGDVQQFVYLDVAVRWPCYGPRNADRELAPQQSWNLDPYELGYGVPIAGWPHLVHFRSRRADANAAPGDAGFYQEDGELLEAERTYREELPDVPGVVIVAR